MAGNVMEFCSTETGYTVRGGYWTSSSAACAVTTAKGAPVSNSRTGFRILIDAR